MQFLEYFLHDYKNLFDSDIFHLKLTIVFPDQGLLQAVRNIEKGSKVRTYNITIKFMQCFMINNDHRLSILLYASSYSNMLNMA